MTEVSFVELRTNKADNLLISLNTVYIVLNVMFLSF